MPRCSSLIKFFLLLFALCLAGFSQNQVTTPEKFFGFIPGSDRQLFTYEQLVDYLKLLEKETDRIRLRQIGKSPMGLPMYIAFISSGENLARLDELKSINRELTFNVHLSQEQLDEYVEKGRVFVLGTLSMHSNEVGPSQAAPIIAYQLATATDPEILQWLSRVVYMMVPSHNPDGMNMVVHYYLKTRGTKYEGSTLPGVYHKYVGHDNNRDFITLTQEDTRAIAAIYNSEWFPQVMVEKHQMGSYGPRYFVPPPHDPIAENVDGEIWSWIGVFGSNLMNDMTRAGLKGVSQHFLFDDYWPGSTETCIWKNVIGFLTECAGVQIATPIYVDPTEFRVSGKGLSEYKKSINMPDPWPGGWWRLSDIVEYERVSTFSILKTAARYWKEILRFRNEIGKKEVQKGLTEAPFYYHLPCNQPDQSELVRLINLLREHGVKVYIVTENLHTPAGFLAKGDVVIPLAQPFRAFIKEVMEKQEYPVRHYTPDGEIIKPYDITSWSLPLHRGVVANEINSRIKLEAISEISGAFTLNALSEFRGKWAILSVWNNQAYQLAFQTLEAGIEVSRVTECWHQDSLHIHKGSFVIPVNEKTISILKTASFSPVMLDDISGLKTRPVQLPRIALVETYLHDMDAGWTRFLFDSYHIPYTVIRPGEFEKTDFTRLYDVVIFPDNNRDILMEGKRKREQGYSIPFYDPQYTKGIGKKGLNRLLRFINNGGKVISWGQSTELFMQTLTLGEKEEEKEEFNLPVRNVAPEYNKKGLYCPGSLVKVIPRKDNPITLGLPDSFGVFYRGNPIFETSIPQFDIDRKILGHFPEKDILLSGYAEKIDLIGNHPAMVMITKGKGELLLFSFNPQFRNSTSITFKLIFNSLLNF